MAIRYVDRLEDISDLTGAYYVNCPFCVEHGKTPDTQHKLGVTFGNVNKYNCYRCPASGVADDLFETKLNRHTYFNNVVGKLFRPTRSDTVDERVMKELIDYANISIEIQPFHSNAIEYLYHRRGLSEAEINKYLLRIGVHSNPLYRNRILVPTFDEWGNCVYVVARDYMDQSDMKYRNPPETHKAYAVWNANRIKEGDVVTVCEGVFSGIASGRHCPDVTPVAIFGKLMSDQQAKIIASRKPGHVVLSLDGDVRVDTLEQNRDILKKFYHGKISIARLPEKDDPDSMSGHDYRELVETSMRSSIVVRA